jgi:predicted dehydrogenase
VEHKTNVGIIGCGQISSIYMESPQLFDILNIVACADIDMDRARAQAQRYNIPHVYTVEELLVAPNIEIVVNLTIPVAHAKVSMDVINAGKSVYGEKPLAIDKVQGKALLETAYARQLRVGSAPDTFLGGGIQTCIKLINEGKIGTPVAATAFMLNHGPEVFHHNPDFYYQPGGGPMFDMGPYYLTALINLIGPIRRVSAVAHTAFPERAVLVGPLKGQIINVNTPTHIAGIMDFANGAVGTLITSFDVWSHTLPRIEIYGTEGTLSVPDPNTFGGPVLINMGRSREWQEIPLAYGYTSNSRGIGLADMAYAMRSSRMHRANGDMAYHVLDVMQSFLESSKQGKHIELTSTCERPAPLRTGDHPWEEQESVEASREE